MKTYKINYIDYEWAEEKSVIVCANNSAEAYVKAVYEVLKFEPYSAYVESYTTKDGKKHIFRQNIHGKAY